MNAEPSKQGPEDASAAQVQVLRAEEFDAAIFDLDGVITQTARVHAAAWKQLFDDFLSKRAGRTGEPFRPFDTETDYPEYVDGKPRFDGIDSFLRSRGIELPWGEPSDDEDEATVCGLGNRKNRYFHERLEHDGVDVFESSVRLVKALREAGIKTAIGSSSRNAAAVLKTAGLTDLFDALVDGSDLARLNLKGKPAPDLFLLAAKEVGADPRRAIVFEDAISGVQAGSAGGFRHVIGVDRRGAPHELRQGGADIVVSDLASLKLKSTPSQSAGKGS